jgi:hypothetical protein
MGNECALDGELENGLAEFGDGLRGCVKEVKVVADATPGVGEVIRLAGGEKPVKGGVVKVEELLLFLLLPLFQFVT